MSKKREILLKVIITIGAISSLLFIYFDYFYEFKKEEKYLPEVIIFSTIMCVFGFLTIFLGSYKVKPPKPKKYYLKQKTYEELTNYIENRIKEYNYEKYYENENIKIYERIIKRKKFYIVDVRAKELTEENLEEIKEKLEEEIEGLKTRKRLTYITLIVSVDRITNTFNKLIDIKEAENNLLLMSVGISFGGNKIYIARDLYDYNPCKKINKEIIEIMELEEIK